MEKDAFRISNSTRNISVQGLSEKFTIADDILIVGNGTTKHEARQDNDKNLTTLLNRCRQQNIKFNKDKCKFARSQVTYMGHILMMEGHQPDPSKIEAIMKMQKPTNIARVRRLVGMVNYLARFWSHLSDICEPLRQLTKSSRHAMAMDTGTLSSIQVVEAILTHSDEREHVPHMHAVPRMDLPRL